MSKKRKKSTYNSKINLEKKYKNLLRYIIEEDKVKNKMKMYLYRHANLFNWKSNTDIL